MTLPVAVPLLVEAFRSAARSLRRTPWVTAVVVFTLSAHDPVVSRASRSCSRFWC